MNWSLKGKLESGQQNLTNFNIYQETIHIILKNHQNETVY